MSRLGNWAKGKQGFQETPKAESSMTLEAAVPEPMPTEAERYAAEIPKLSAAMAKARNEGTPEGTERQVKLARAVVAAHALSQHDEARGIAFSKFKHPVSGRTSVFIDEIQDGDGEPVLAGTRAEGGLIRSTQVILDNMNMDEVALDKFAEDDEHMQTWTMLTEGRQAARDADVVKEL
jgi:hypothetical protein